MAKVPSELGVRFTISDISMEVPKPLFENAAIKVAIFFGRKGKSGRTRRTKWFTLADPSTVSSSTRQMVALPPEGDHQESSRRASTTRAGVDENEDSVRQVAGELAVLEFGGLNNVVYDTILKPLNKFDGEWVFDQKLTHPVTVFAKAFIKMRPGAKANIAKSEQDSNINEMIQLDQSEMDENDFSSGDEKEGIAELNDQMLDMEGVHLTAEQLSLLTDGKSENEILIEQLKAELDCKKRYLAFPKTIDLGAVANTRAKTLEFSERVKSKSASLLGSVISFKIHADIDEGTLANFEVKKKEKDDKAERKRREKEEKILEKERKKREKAEAKEKKKRGVVEEHMYGADITNNDGEGAAVTTEASKSKAADTPEKQKSGFSPFSKIKNIFTSKEKTQITPFPLKFENTPYPYLFLLDKFVLHKLTMPPDFYRAIHIRLGCDPVALDGFPMLLLNTDNKSYIKEVDIAGYDGQPKHVFKFDFGNTHIYFGDKHIRNITGFDSIRALTEREKDYAKAQEDTEKGIEHEPRQESNEIFRAEFLNVGEKFHPIDFQATRYSAMDAQVASTKYTRVVAHLVIPKRVDNLTIVTDEEEKANYLKAIKKEQQKKEKEEKKAAKLAKQEEKKRLKAEKKAASKADKGEGSEDSNDDSDNSDTDVADTVTEHSSLHEAPAVEQATNNAEADAVEQATSNVEADAEEKKSNNADDAEKQSGEDDSVPAFESGGADQQSKAPKESKESREPKASKESRYSVNKTSSFQIGLQLINEENVPAAGIAYAIRFVTGEELTFRARRVFLPSVSPFNAQGASKVDVPLLSFTPNA